MKLKREVNNHRQRSMTPPPMRDSHLDQNRSNGRVPIDRSRSASRERELDEYTRNNSNRNRMMIDGGDRTLRDFTPPRRGGRSMSRSRSRSPARMRSRRNSLTLSD